MTLQENVSLFVRQIKDTPLLQWLGVAFGVAEVLFARINKIWLYPTGIISTAIAMYILYQSDLFAEAALNLYYLVMSIYGWWYWEKRNGQPQVKVGYATKQELMITALIVIGGFCGLYFILAHYTPSTVPVWDAWVSATAWAGMWLLAKRKIENWILLNISNAFAIPLLLHKELPLYAVLTVFLFIIAIQGYYKWKKAIIAESQTS